MLHRILAITAMALVALPATAQTATQDVTVVVPEVESIAVGAGAVTLTFTTPTAGSAFTDATQTSSYNITVNTEDNKITGLLDSDFATGITLSVKLAAPSGASSEDYVDLSTTAADLVTDVATVNATGLSIDYTASATSEALPNGPGETNTVTFTITDQ